MTGLMFRSFKFRVGKDRVKYSGGAVAFGDSYLLVLVGNVAFDVVFFEFGDVRSDRFNEFGRDLGIELRVF
jgi:hypothetical protein